MESYATAVNAYVGNAPGGRTTVLVDDPSGDANGFAIPLLGEPVIMLWPTPPAPSLTFGEHRGWGEILGIHEYAHIAHLTFPSRNPRERLLWRLLPARLGPVARKAPAWVFEGYATLIEGRLTGSGRPHSAGRAAILREWALSGNLPSYGALDNANTFYGGAMRYLLGSAFLEWLAARKGYESLKHLWLRMSARQPRSFAEAFAGVYGAPPDELYGTFVVELTERALKARDALNPMSVEGALFQRLTSATGEPAVSPDGGHVAVPLRSPGRPSRLVIWRTDSAGVDSSVLRARARIFARDSLDVPPVDSFPLPRRAVATLRAVAGAGYNNPRWLRGGNEVLVTREVPLGDGASRPDVFVWNWRSGAVRRVTRGAGVRYADPDPTGQRAVGSRCADGRCGLVMIDLATGRFDTLVAGAYDETWHRPRWSPRGDRIAASVHRAGRWQIALVDPRGSVTFVAVADSASRHSPTWFGENVVVVSDRGGVPNLEQLSPDGSSQFVTRALGAVAAPDAGSGRAGIWYLDLHAKGLDVRHLAGVPSAISQSAALPTSLAPAAQRSGEPAPRFDSAHVSVRDYSGIRHGRLYPGFGGGADGTYGLLALANYDPVGKLGTLLQVAAGSDDTWSGVSLGAVWRGWRAIELRTQVYRARLFDSKPVQTPLNYGSAVTAGRTFDYGTTAWSWNVGADYAHASVGNRVHAFAEMSVGRRRSEGLLRAFSLRTQGSVANSGDVDVARVTASLGAVAALGPLRVRLSSRGGMTSIADDTSAAANVERFSVGGLAPPLYDERLLPQRISEPALRSATAVGNAYVSHRTSVTQAGLPAALYVAWFRVYDPNSSWQRLAGIEGEQRFAPISFVSVPNVTITYGAAYSLDHPRRHRWTIYGGASFAP